MGKAVFYFGVVALLSAVIGHWSVLVGWLHQLLGLAFHIHFSRKHGFSWWAVEDPERYVALSKAMVGVAPGPEEGSAGPDANGRRATGRRAPGADEEGGG